MIETPYASGLDITTGLRSDRGGLGADLITEESAVHWEIKSALDVFAGSLDCPHITDFTPPNFPNSPSSLGEQNGQLTQR